VSYIVKIKDKSKSRYSC